MLYKLFFFMKYHARVLLVIFTLVLFLQGKSALALFFLPERTACLEQTLCSSPGNTVGCTNEDTDPLTKVHTTLLTIRQPLTSGDAYLHECITLRTGVQECIIIPARNNNGTLEIPNYVSDGENDTSSVDWNDPNDKVWYENALRHYCLAGVRENTTGEAISHCDEEVTERMAQLEIALAGQNYQFHGLYNPSPAQMRGPGGQYTRFPVEAALNNSYLISTRTEEDLVHSFRITTFSDPGQDPSAGEPSDKIARLAFESNAPICPNAPSYDPLGQVFNLTTLEPVEDVRVVLYLKDEVQTSPTYNKYIRAIRNAFPDPNVIGTSYKEVFPTNYLGSFAFRVPPGNYKLLALRDGVAVPPLLPDPLSLTAFNGLGTVMDLNATLFGDEIRVTINGRPQTLYPEIYQVGESATPGDIEIPNIEETTVAERRDISITKDSVGPKIVSFYKRTNNIRKIVIKGHTNIPFGVVYAKSDATGHILDQTTADLKGEFTLYVEPNRLASPTDLLLVPESANYVRVEASLSSPLAYVKEVVRKILGAFTHVVYAQTKSNEVKVGPILNQVQGYAKDASGNVLPGAQVYLINSVMGGVESQTVADEKGFFAFSTEALPYEEFYLKYQPKDSTKMLKVEVDQFIAQNADYIAKEEVNLVQVQYSGEAQTYLTQNPLPTEIAEQGPSMGPKQGTPGQLNQGVSPTRAVEQNNPANQLSPALLMYVAILLLLIVGAGLLIVYYMKRKQEPHLYE